MAKDISGCLSRIILPLSDIQRCLFLLYYYLALAALSPVEKFLEERLIFEIGFSKIFQAKKRKPFVS